MNVPQIIPFHHAYPRPQVLTPQKKNSDQQTVTFQEVLKKKMKQKNGR
ncbi:hypothetical protein PAJ34TS1_08360 [Paenibacillus azoreducens]|uniref:Uncharacterized protein n=1 Tax=Paenibacillus azoreducens TaxID=116718 RepID=A0A920CT19_9BACL|nr:hypothetical protein J34TS1_46650 [Paenibacillus azoreducens]